ncbi:hypothetical protein CANCADRAFT_2397 [Tortispora caseinolytica NRRL Y-17796]|uniref:FHA domain-containing protein n=1 Tax=Tortispora caseinolytica NRRL Y-17796 TaxID=767744 RepID=A0A1E4TG32_9ASCO|nr:hypothetical protein CANCADRAFT_2397 [Tortispora caseinolytica NRRL Y-17796]
MSQNSNLLPANNSYNEPETAQIPSEKYSLIVFKGEQIINQFRLEGKSSYKLGRDSATSDIVIAHPSCSKNHAVIQFKSSPDDPSKVVPYLIDLNSANGTKINFSPVPQSRFIQLKSHDVLNFAYSTRDYVFQNEN